MTIFHVIKYADALSRPLLTKNSVPVLVYHIHETWLNNLWHNTYGPDGADDSGRRWYSEDNVQAARAHLQELLLNYNGDE